MNVTEKSRLTRFGCALVICTLLLGGCQTSPSKPVEEGCTEEGKACAVEETADETLFFTPMTFDESIAFFQDGKSGILYYGFPDCPWCQDVVPILEALSTETGQTVYYIRTRDAERNRLYSDEQKEEILPYLQDYMSEDEDGVMTLYVPVVVSVVDGKAVAGHVGTVEGHDAHERDLTDEEKKQVEAALQEVLDSQK